MAHLEIDGVPRGHALMAERVVVGSQAGCDLIVPGDEVSPEHAEFQRTQDGWRIVDLESRHGTRVNGRYVNQHDLAEGDEIRIGATRFVFRAASAAPAPSARAPSAKSRAPARGAAAAPARNAPPARRGGRTAPPPSARRGRSAEPVDEEEARLDALEEEQEYRAARAAERAAKERLNVILISSVSLVVIAVMGYFLLRPSMSVNDRVTMRMLQHKDALLWAEMIEDAKEAQDTGDYVYQRIQDLVAEARANMVTEDKGKLGTAAIDAWRDVQLWRQGHWKDDDEFVARIDAYLAEYGGVGGASVEEARNARVKITGAADASLPKDAADAWSRLLDLQERCKSTGTYGEALRQVDAFWATYGARNPQFVGDRDRLIAALKVEANQWFAKRAYMAKHNAEQGAGGKGRKILAEAVKALDMPEFEAKAAQVLREMQ